MKTLKLLELALLAHLCVGCSDSRNDKTSNEYQQSEETVGCIELSMEDCDGDARCMIIEGAVVDESMQCSGEKQDVACAETNTCPPAIRYARDPSGKLWEFAAGCSPTGWHVEQPEYTVNSCSPEGGTLTTGFAEIGAPVPGEDCSVLSREACASNSDCMLVGGNRVIDSDQCIEDVREVVACRNEASCPPDLRCARGPSGQLWAFVLGCTPTGWPVEDCGYYSYCSTAP